jgi:hypothetical protein
MSKKPEKIPTTNAEGRELVRATMRDAELARSIGISRAAIGKWKADVPADRVNQVAEATGLKPEWIRPQPYA